MRVVRTIVILVFCISPVAAADWPQWRGPNRDGTSPETGLLTRWPGRPQVAVGGQGGGTGLLQHGERWRQTLHRRRHALDR